MLTLFAFIVLFLLSSWLNSCGLIYPFPFQLVSLDFVGFYDYNNRSYYFLVLFDLASRLIMLLMYLLRPNGQLISVDFRISIFGVPSAILCDRGFIFKSRVFRDYTLNKLMALLVFTSVYYTQGNSINKSFHRVVDSTLNNCLFK